MVRPAVDERAVVAEASIDLVDGVIGDNWRARGNHRTFDGSADPLAQVTLVSSRVAAAIAGPHDRWQLSGDQLFVDLDLSRANLPAGTRLAVGSAVLEVTPKPHRGCDKFRARFGTDALALRELGGRARAQPARRQRRGGRRGHRACRGRDPQAATLKS